MQIATTSCSIEDHVLCHLGVHTHPTLVHIVSKLLLNDMWKTKLPDPSTWILAEDRTYIWVLKQIKLFSLSWKVSWLLTKLVGRTQRKEAVYNMCNRLSEENTSVKPSNSLNNQDLWFITVKNCYQQKLFIMTVGKNKSMLWKRNPWVN